ncbi:PucR family transcriptional regulator [Nocardia fluminea]|uniref:PucR-like helix-turn-helix protein n=1 Tax=Nocardia fluminea TaxID=134984 RepID=A0A2N3VJT5_9NOCA|nr:helix-turn-helix domain-containing protein [Nocardia fluminea]PKV81876.1 PucR-like helix-turn-helix protein [Nocardia fluminea]
MVNTEDVGNGAPADLELVGPTLTVTVAAQSVPRENVLSIAAQRHKRSVRDSAPFGSVPVRPPGDPLEIAHICRELVAGMIEGGDAVEATQRIRGAAVEWARAGVPIDDVLAAVYDGFESGASELIGGWTTGDSSNLTSGVEWMLEVLSMTTSAVAVAYLDQGAGEGIENYSAEDALASAMLNGRADFRMVREFGIDVADAYSVLAIALPLHREDTGQEIEAVRRLSLVRAELARQCGDTAMSVLNVGGGTILLPQSVCDDDRLATVVAALSAAANVPVIAAVVRSARDEIPLAVTQAHELLEVIERLGLESGLHFFDSLALEYQITRPGPGRAALASLLEPLAAHTELWETLCCYIGNDLNRRAAASALGVHANTIDYRIKRVGQLTGLDLTLHAGLWYARSALIAYTFVSENIQLPRGTVIRSKILT